MSTKEFREMVREIWSEAPAADLCLNILDFLTSMPATQLQMLTVRELKRASGAVHIDENLLTAIAILTNSQFAVLEARALFVDPASGDEMELEPSEFNEVRETGQMIHPITGLPVKDLPNHIIPFFVPTEQFLAETHGS